MARFQQVCANLNPFRRSSRSRSSSVSGSNKLRISPPTSQPFNYDRHPIPPWANDYSTHSPNRLPIPPPKDYSLKYMPLPAGAAATATAPATPASRDRATPFRRMQQASNHYVQRHHIRTGPHQRKRSATDVTPRSSYSDTESLLDSYYAAARSPVLSDTLGSLTPARVWNGGKRLLARPDLHGNERYLGQYEELTRPDWGEPEEWVDGAHQHHGY